MKVVKDGANVSEQNVASGGRNSEEGSLLLWKGNNLSFICEILLKNICLRTKWKFLTWEYCGGA